MKKALISSKETTHSYDGTPLGQRVAQVSDTTFEVDPDFLSWIDCSDDVVADQFYWDGSSFIAVPVPPPPVVPEAQQVTTEVTGQGGPNVIA